MKLVEPQTPEQFEQYFELRWRILRAPWQQPRGSERDDEENLAYHIMAVQSQQVVGVARLQFPEAQTAQLRYMAVDDAFQGQGIGACIVTHMENYARQQSAHTLMLHARQNAVGFYQALKYKILEPSYLLFNEIQHYKMAKPL